MDNLYTCLSCQVAFQNPQDQRIHMRSDWHRYNLKRKVADLGPVSAHAFAQKLQAVQGAAVEAQAPVDLECTLCRKSYNSENAYNHHLSSKKHKELMLKEPILNKSTVPKEPSQPLPKTDWQSLLMNAKSEAEIEALLERKRLESPVLKETDCLFCTHASKDLETNMKHMMNAHSFFIPDIEFLVDLKGLIGYLGEKISIANVCIYCNGKGRGFHSLEAVRDHMVGKGHCKIQYEDDADLEVAEFYDFSDTWEDVEDGDEEDVEADWEETEEGVGKPAKALEIAQDESELVLPSGHRIGHRSLKMYYKQSLKPLIERDAKTIKRIAGTYESVGFANPSSALATRAKQQKMAIYHKEMTAKKQLYREQDFRGRIGMRQNNLQKHYRDQIGFST